MGNCRSTDGFHEVKSTLSSPPASSSTTLTNSSRHGSFNEPSSRAESTPRCSLNSNIAQHYPAPQQLVETQNLSTDESQHLLKVINKQKQDRQNVTDLLVKFIDFYIRTRPYFHSGKPLLCKCPLAALREELGVINYMKRLNKFQPMSLEGFIEQQKEHFVLDEEQRHVSVKYKTPFRGTDKTTTMFVIGHYRCYKCKQKWVYEESMVDQVQRCSQCSSHCYPYLQLSHTFQQDRLPTSEESLHKTEHDCTVCKKCIDLGRLCIPTMYYEKKKEIKVVEEWHVSPTGEVFVSL